MSQDHCPPACAEPGIPWCDPRLEGLASSKEGQLVLIKDGCFYRLPPRAAGVVFATGDGVTVSSVADNEPELNAPLKQLLRYEMGADGELAVDEDGKLIEATPPGADWVMVLSQQGIAGSCLDNLAWRKLRGKPNVPGWFHWDGGKFHVAPTHAAQLSTSRVIQRMARVRLLGLDPNIVTSSAQEKIARALHADYIDLIANYPDEDNAPGGAAPFNPSGDTGWLVYQSVDGRVRPIVIPFCAVGEDECGTKPGIVEFVGCDGSGKPTSSMGVPVLPQGACAHVLSHDGFEGYKPAPLGRTFWPMQGELLSRIAQAGNISGQVLKNRFAALGPVPVRATHARVRIELQCQSTVELGATVSLRLNGHLGSYCTTVGNANDYRVNELTVELLPATTINYVVQHSRSTDSTWEVKIYLVGYEVCSSHPGTDCSPVAVETPPGPEPTPTPSPGPGPGPSPGPGPG